MEHKNSTNTQKKKTLSNQNKHYMAEENSTKKLLGQKANPEKQI